MSLSRAQIVALNDAMESHHRSLGVFETVNMHEPKAAPQILGVTAATWIQHLGPARGGSGLSSTTVRMEYRTRVYTNMLREPQDFIDPEVVTAAGAVMESFSEDFTLGGRVRQVDLLGQFGTPLSMQAGYLNNEGKLYRVMDVIVPLIVNDVWDQEA